MKKRQILGILAALFSFNQWEIAASSNINGDGPFAVQIMNSPEVANNISITWKGGDWSLWAFSSPYRYQELQWVGGSYNCANFPPLWTPDHKVLAGGTEVHYAPILDGFKTTFGWASTITVDNNGVYDYWGFCNQRAIPVWLCKKGDMYLFQVGSQCMNGYQEVTELP